MRILHTTYQNSRVLCSCNNTSAWKPSQFLISAHSPYECISWMLSSGLKSKSRSSWRRGVALTRQRKGKQWENSTEWRELTATQDHNSHEVFRWVSRSSTIPHKLSNIHSRCVRRVTIAIPLSIYSRLGQSIRTEGKQEFWWHCQTSTIEIR